MMARGISTRYARGVLGSLPLVIGGFVVLMIPHVSGAGLQIALLVIGTGLTGSIYVVCAPMISEYTPVSQRGSIIATFGAIYTLAGIMAPLVMGSMVQRAATPLEGYYNGFTINAVLLIVAGIAGLLLMWPNTEKARLARAVSGALVQKAA
jgi:MFS family permease